MGEQPRLREPGDALATDRATPNNNLIYVQEVPVGQATPTPVTTKCATGEIGDGLPVSNDYNATLRDELCHLGSAYIDGTLKGRLTVSAENNIVVTGNLAYSGGAGGIDTLGLIANNSVKVSHPVRCTNLNTTTNVCSAGTDLDRPNGTKFRDPQIHASTLTLQHSFTVQSWRMGSQLGVLTAFGAISQRYRGPVGVGESSDTGYLKLFL